MYPDMMTEREAVAIMEAMEAGWMRGADARSDGAIDSDPLLDSRMVGKRIADGFRLLSALES